MTDRPTPSAADIANDMNHVSNAADATNVANELRQAVGGMSSADALSFVREINRDRNNKPGQGEQMNVLTDMTHAHVELNNPYGPQVRIDLPSIGSQNASTAETGIQANRRDQPADKPAALTPEKVAADMDRVSNSADATAAFSELGDAVNGMNVHDTIDFIKRTSQADHKRTGADVALVVGDNGEAQISFTSPYQPEQRATITDDSKAGARR